MRRVGIVVVVFGFIGFLFADEIDDLLAKLGAEDWAEREAASKALVAKGSSVIPRLLEAFKTSGDSETKMRISAILKQLGHPGAEAVAEIEKCVSEYRRLVDAPLTNEEFKKETEALLEKMRKLENVAPYLAERLGESADVDLSLALAFFLNGLVEGMGEESSLGGTTVIERGGQVIVRIGNRKIVMGEGDDGEEGFGEGLTPAMALLGATKSGDEKLNNAALRALVKRKELSVVGELIKYLLKSPSEEGTEAQLVLRRLRKQKEEGQTAEKEKKVKIRLAAALRELTGESFGPDEKTEDFSSEIGKWTEWWNTTKDKPEYREARLKEEILLLKLKEAQARRQLRAFEKKQEELKKALEEIRKPKEESPIPEKGKEK
ncbi:MAG: hypothetical protein N2234_01935 [Planctomycetota bacterium]|nr:hypothetical protein [Planctomycetota bacterium]